MDIGDIVNVKVYRKKRGTCEYVKSDENKWKGKICYLATHFTGSIPIPSGHKPIYVVNINDDEGYAFVTDDDVIFKDGEYWQK